jgi:hypothetical protein
VRDDFHHVGFAVTTSLLDGAAHRGGDGVVAVFLNAITVEAVVLPPLLFTAVLLMLRLPETPSSLVNRCAPVWCRRSMRWPRVVLALGVLWSTRWLARR